MANSCGEEARALLEVLQHNFSSRPAGRAQRLRTARSAAYADGYQRSDRSKYYKIQCTCATGTARMSTLSSRIPSANAQPMPVSRSRAQSRGSGPVASAPLAASCSHMARMPASVMSSTAEGIGTLVGSCGSRGLFASGADSKRPFSPLCVPAPRPSVGRSKAYARAGACIFLFAERTRNSVRAPTLSPRRGLAGRAETRRQSRKGIDASPLRRPTA